MRQNRFGALIQTFSQKTAKNQISGRFPPGGITDNNLDFYTGIIIYVTFSDIVFLTFGVKLHKSGIEKMPNSLQLQEKNNSMILTMECFFVYLFFEKTFDFSVVFS